MAKVSVDTQEFEVIPEDAAAGTSPVELFFFGREVEIGPASVGETFSLREQLLAARVEIVEDLERLQSGARLSWMNDEERLDTMIRLTQFQIDQLDAFMAQLA